MKKIFKKIEKLALTVAAVVLANVPAHAQDISKFTSAINTAVSNIKNVFGSLTNLIFAIAAIIGVIGVVIVYGKFANGDPNATKSAISWGAAVIFIVVGAAFLKIVFGM